MINFERDEQHYKAQLKFIISYLGKLEKYSGEITDIAIMILDHFRGLFSLDPNVGFYSVRFPYYQNYIYMEHPHSYEIFWTSSENRQDCKHVNFIWDKQQSCFKYQVPPEVILSRDPIKAYFEIKIKDKSTLEKLFPEVPDLVSPVLVKE